MPLLFYQLDTSAALVNRTRLDSAPITHSSNNSPEICTSFSSFNCLLSSLWQHVGLCWALICSRACVDSEGARHVVGSRAELAAASSSVSRVRRRSAGKLGVRATRRAQQQAGKAATARSQQRPARSCKAGVRWRSPTQKRTSCEHQPCSPVHVPDACQLLVS